MQENVHKVMKEKKELKIEVAINCGKHKSKASYISHNLALQRLILILREITFSAHYEMKPNRPGGQDTNWFAYGKDASAIRGF